MSWQSTVALRPVGAASVAEETDMVGGAGAEPKVANASVTREDEIIRTPTQTRPARRPQRIPKALRARRSSLRMSLSMTSHPFFDARLPPDLDEPQDHEHRRDPQDEHPADQRLAEAQDPPPQAGHHSPDAPDRGARHLSRPRIRDGVGVPLRLERGMRSPGEDLDHPVAH